jgi:hypothetical protein
MHTGHPSKLFYLSKVSLLTLNIYFYNSLLVVYLSFLFVKCQPRYQIDLWLNSRYRIWRASKGKIKNSLKTLKSNYYFVSLRSWGDNKLFYLLRSRPRITAKVHTRCIKLKPVTVAILKLYHYFGAQQKCIIPQWCERRVQALWHKTTNMHIHKRREREASPSLFFFRNSSTYLYSWNVGCIHFCIVRCFLAATPEAIRGQCF